jgi:hypothetical protein
MKRLNMYLSAHPLLELDPECQNCSFAVRGRLVRKCSFRTPPHKHFVKSYIHTAFLKESKVQSKRGEDSGAAGLFFHGG